MLSSLTWLLPTEAQLKLSGAREKFYIDAPGHSDSAEDLGFEGGGAAESPHSPQISVHVLNGIGVFMQQLFHAPGKSFPTCGSVIPGEIP